MNVFASISSRLVLGGAVVAALFCGSCTPVHFANPEPYIGPVKPIPSAPGPKPAVAPGEAPPAVKLPPKSGEAPAKSGEASVKPGEAPAKPGEVSAKPIPAPDTISVSITEAMLTALANNQSLTVQKLNTPITRTLEENAAAIFDPDLAGSIQTGRSRGKGSEPSPFSTAKNISGDFGFSQFFPTGTTVAATAETSGALSGDNFFSTRAGMTVTQALLRGYGTDVNLATLRQTRIDTLTTQYELRGFAETLVSQVEETYWTYAAAQRNIEIFTQSLKLAEDQLRETDERIKVGKLAEIERAAAEAEVALRREDLINANRTLEITRLQLLRLMNPADANYWTRDVSIQIPSELPAIKLDPVADHVQVAMRLRPDLNQARLLVQRDDLQLVKTKNGLLPKMDLFVTLGKTGYAESFVGSAGRMGGPGYDALVGVSMEYPPQNRDAIATNQRATLSRRQAVESVTNVEQLVQVDVRSAYVEVVRSREQVAATAVTRRLQEEKVRAETEKFRVGKSTTLLVGQAQRDLLQSQINEVIAKVAYMNACVELFRLEGSLLERRGIECPGREPVQMPPARM
jgi:outer membrane protein